MGDEKPVEVDVTHAMVVQHRWSIPLHDDPMEFDALHSAVVDAHAALIDAARDPDIRNARAVWFLDDSTGHEQLVIAVETTERLQD